MRGWRRRARRRGGQTRGGRAASGCARLRGGTAGPPGSAVRLPGRRGRRRGGSARRAGQGPLRRPAGDGLPAGPRRVVGARRQAGVPRQGGVGRARARPGGGPAGPRGGGPLCRQPVGRPEAGDPTTPRPRRVPAHAGCGAGRCERRARRERRRCERRARRERRRPCWRVGCLSCRRYLPAGSGGRTARAGRLVGAAWGGLARPHRAGRGRDRAGRTRCCGRGRRRPGSGPTRPGTDCRPGRWATTSPSTPPPVLRSATGDFWPPAAIRFPSWWARGLPCSHRWPSSASW